MNEFDHKTSEQIGYYVYCLIDPRTDKPFYIGKGKGNRVFAHAQDALDSIAETDKLNTIREIKSSGNDVNHIIIQHGLNEETAFAIESALIDFAECFNIGLSNLVLGHKSYAFGLMTAEEIQRKYSAEPLKELDNGCVIININKTYKRAKGSKNYYEATKEAWAISDKRIPTIKYVLSEYRGFIVEVFKVDNDGWYKIKDHNGRQRWGFNGRPAPENIRSKYLNCSINKKRGAANPITFQISQPVE